MANELYANIHPSSKYTGQATDHPFPVELTLDPEGYIVSGNNNHYRLCDLELFVPMRAPTTAVSGDVTTREGIPLIAVASYDGLWLHRALNEMLTWAKQQTRSLEGRNALYQTGEWDGLRQKLMDLARLFPTDEPRCSECAEYFSRCECDHNHVLY